MKEVLTAAKRLLCPPAWVRLFVPPVVFAVLVGIFVTGQEEGVPAYAVYTMSAYCLIILALPLPKQIRRVKAAILRRVNGTAFGARYVNDPAFRGSVSLYQNAAVNFFYMAFRMFAGIRYASVWFISMAVYYWILGGLRLYLLWYYRRRDKNELYAYRRTAWLLFMLNIPMGGMIFLMVVTNSGYSYPGYIIYLSALYTFYTAAMSVINLIRYRRLGSPVLSAAKALNFIAALMSVLGLQTAMIARFSAEDDSFRKMMNAAVGGVVWLSVVLTAICMLHRSKRKEEVRTGEPIRK